MFLASEQRKTFKWQTFSGHMLPSACFKCTSSHRKSFKHVLDDSGHFVCQLRLSVLLFLLCNIMSLYFVLVKATLSNFFFPFICCLESPSSCLIFCLFENTYRIRNSIVEYCWNFQTSFSTKMLEKILRPFFS